MDSLATLLLESYTPQVYAIVRFVGYETVVARFPMLSKRWRDEMAHASEPLWRAACASAADRKGLFVPLHLPDTSIYTWRGWFWEMVWPGTNKWGSSVCRPDEDNDDDDDDDARDVKIKVVVRFRPPDERSSRSRSSALTIPLHQRIRLKRAGVLASMKDVWSEVLRRMNFVPYWIRKRASSTRTCSQP